MSTQTMLQQVQAKQTKPALYHSAAAWLVVMVTGILAIFSLRAPNPEPASVSPAEFSSVRAMEHVRVMAAVPHPIGSAANQTVSRYLLAQLSNLGFQPKLFQAVGTSGSGHGIAIGLTQSVVGRFAGTANSRAIMLVAHYDSVYRSSGAADDVAGVAAILETIRALRASSPLKNDIIVLFTDGEEEGLLGAEAFAASHSWMKDVGLVLNFEARGNKGPSLLFETSRDNGTLIDVVSRSASYPLGSSLFYSLYKLLPNDTDYTVFRRLNVPGLNFAFGENLEAYHSQLDTPEALSLSSLQHHGSNALSLTRAFGQMDLSALSHSRGDSIFFNWMGTRLVAYRQSWVIPGQIFLSVLFLTALLLNIRRTAVRKARVFTGFLYSVLFVLALPIIAAAAQWLVSRLLGARAIVADSSANALLLSGLVLLCITAGILVFSFGRRFFRVMELVLCGVLLALLLSWVLAYLLPAASYLLFWPLLTVSAGLLVESTLPSTDLIRSVTGFAAAAVTVLLFAPVIYLIYIFLTLQLITALCVGLLTGLAFLICGPWVEAAVPERAWRAGLSIIASAAVITIVGGMVISHRGTSHPRRDSLLYGIDADAHKAAWITYDRTLDPWTSRTISNQPQSRGPAPGYLGGVQQPVLLSAAPLLDLAAPIAQVEADRQENGFRTIRLRIASPRKADVILLSFGKDSHPVSVSVDGRNVTFTGNSDFRYIKLFGMGNQDDELNLTFQLPAKAVFWLSDQSFGLPVSVGHRPEGIIAADGSDITLVSRKYDL